MSIDLDTHRNAILKAFNDVVSEKSATDWALFGYEGQTNVLKVIGSGEDGLEELSEDLNTGKIMYAVVQVQDPNTTRNKVVLINWQGEGAPDIRKGTCARHLPDVHKLLRGVHVTVNARNEEEVEPEFVMAAVLKASATTYNFNDRSEMSDKTTPVLHPPGASGPVARVGDGGSPQTFPLVKPKPKLVSGMGTNYKRTNPLAEINSKSRNKFWEEQEAEERRRKVEEQQRKDQELKQLETERKQRELKEAQQRDQATKERNARINEERRAEEAAAQRCAPKEDLAWQKELQSQQAEESERGKRAEQMRLERKKEAESLIGSRTVSARAMFEGGGSAASPQDRNRPPPRKLKEFRPVNNDDGPGDNEGKATPGRGVAARWPPAVESPQQPATPTQRIGSLITGNVGTPVNATVPSASSPPAPPAKQPPEPSPPQPEVGGTYVRNLLMEGLPTRMDSDEEENNKDDWDDGENNAPSPTTLMNNLNLNRNNQPPVQPPPAQEVPFIHQQPPAQSFTQPPAQSFTQSPAQTFTQPPVIHTQPAIIEQASIHHTNGNATEGSRYENIEVVAGLKAAREEPPKKTQANGTAPHDIHVTPQHDSHATPQHDSHATPQQDIPATPHNDNTQEAPSGAGMIYEVDGIEYQILAEHGLCARALYDYQAADDSEITFDPSEIITNIDQIDEGWWQGIGPDGMFGLFPANYVELINQPPV